MDERDRVATFGKFLVGICLLAGVGLLLIQPGAMSNLATMLGNASKTASSFPSAPAPAPVPAPVFKADPHHLAMSSFKIADFKWREQYSVMTADFTFQNDNEIAVKDVEVRCDHSAASGTKIDSNTRTVYELFKPKSRRTIREFNMGFIHSQAKQSSCYVRRLVALPGTELPAKQPRKAAPKT